MKTFTIETSDTSTKVLIDQKQAIEYDSPEQAEAFVDGCIYMHGTSDFQVTYVAIP